MFPNWDLYSLFLRCKITKNLWYGKEKYPKIVRFGCFSADIYANLANGGCKIDIEERISIIAPRGAPWGFITGIDVRIGYTHICTITRACCNDVCLVQSYNFDRRRLKNLLHDY